MNFSSAIPSDVMSTPTVGTQKRIKKCVKFSTATTYSFRVGMSGCAMARDDGAPIGLMGKANALQIIDLKPVKYHPRFSAKIGELQISKNPIVPREDTNSGTGSTDLSRKRKREDAPPAPTQETTKRRKKQVKDRATRLNKRDRVCLLLENGCTEKYIYAFADATLQLYSTTTEYRWRMEKKAKAKQIHEAALARNGIRISAPTQTMVA